MARSIKKGPYIEERLLARVRKMETEEQQECYQDLVAAFNHNTGTNWLHICRA